MIEALAEHLGGAEHRDKGVEVFLMDKCLQLQRLAVGEGRIDHVVGLVGIGTVAGGVGGTAHQLPHDEVTDGVLVVTDDKDGLAHLHLFQHRIDDKALHRQTHEGVKGGVEVEHEAGCQYHGKVGDEEGLAGVLHMGIFFQDKGDDIGAAGGGAHIEEQCRRDGGQGDGENQIQHGLVGQGAAEGNIFFEHSQLHVHNDVQVRSHESLLDEAKMITQEKDFKGYIHDVGGPTANFRQPSCEKQLTRGVCKNRQCLFPKPCPNLKVDHRDYIKLLKELRDIPKVKKVFIRSGIRFDYVVADKSDAFLEELCRYHVSGQLKVAPEHVSDDVLTLMGKPENSVYQEFVKKYNKMNQKIHKDQYLVPYLMSSHPGSRMKDAVELAEHIRDLGYMPEQVQDFYPTPSTISTCMYYTGVDPRTMQPVYVPKNPHEKAMQRALIQYRDPKNYDLVMEALKKAHRMDLVGFDKHCLIRPRKFEGRSQQKVPGQKTQNQKFSGKPGRNDRGKNKNEHSRRNTVQSDRQNSRQNTGTDRSRQKKKSIRNVHKKK